MPSLTISSFAIRSSPHTGFSEAILRISARSSVGIGGRPSLPLNRQNNRHPIRCQRMIVLGRTITTASCQSNKRVRSASPIRVTESTRRGLTPRSMYCASCFRRTKFSARIAEDERKKSRTRLKASESSAATIRAKPNMRRSCHNPADGMPVYPSITSDQSATSRMDCILWAVRALGAGTPAAIRQSDATGLGDA